MLPHGRPDISCSTKSEEGSDMRGDRVLPRGNVWEKGRLSDTISADEAMAPVVCEREGRSPASRS